VTIPETFIRRPVATTLVMVGILIFGIAAYRALPVSDLPSVDYPTIQVQASLSGANPDTMGAAVALPPPRMFKMQSHRQGRNSRMAGNQTCRFNELGIRRLSGGRATVNYSFRAGNCSLHTQLSGQRICVWSVGFISGRSDWNPTLQNPTQRVGTGTLDLGFISGRSGWNPTLQNPTQRVGTGTLDLGFISGRSGWNPTLQNPTQRVGTGTLDLGFISGRSD
jgi:hypothetical protein